MKNFILFAIIPLLSFGQCLIGDCENGYGFYLFTDGVSLYQGDWKNGNEHGSGILIIYDDEGNLILTYDGDWKDGSENGWGTQTIYDEGREYLGTYTGEWKDGSENGWGILVWSKGVVQEGQWRDGEFIE